jgi:hypothetical protein
VSGSRPAADNVQVRVSKLVSPAFIDSAYFLRAPPWPTVRNWLGIFFMQACGGASAGLLYVSTKARIRSLSCAAELFTKMSGPTAEVVSPFIWYSNITSCWTPLFAPAEAISGRKITLSPQLSSSLVAGSFGSIISGERSVTMVNVRIGIPRA